MRKERELFDTVNTPWGRADFATEFADGITFYTTPGHGGFKLSKEREAAVQAKFPGFKTFCGRPGWYEEDCDWAVVALTFPEVFPDVKPAETQAMFNQYCAHRMPLKRVTVSASVMFDESDCGGAFDGFTVTSDADPGL